MRVVFPFIPLLLTPISVLLVFSFIPFAAEALISSNINISQSSSPSYCYSSTRQPFDSELLQHHHPSLKLASLLRRSAVQREESAEANNMPEETTTTSSSSDTKSSSCAPFRLAYVTDVEGNLDYFFNFVKSCPILKVQFHYHKTIMDDSTTSGELLEQTTTTINDGEFPQDNNFQGMVLDFAEPTSSETTSNENYYFVFGGDSVDKGTGDIRLNRCLVEFKKKYPNRVFLLVGNRDLNKLRFSAELSSEDLARDVRSIPGPHWDPSAPTLAEYLRTTFMVEDKESISSDEQLQSLHTRVNRLKYMLKHTLGCPKTFEFRRKELSILQNNRPVEDITDEEVVDNFIYEVQEGSLHDYFHHAQVAVIIGNTLFCHGAVDKDTMKFVPSPQSKFENPPSKPEPWKMVSNAHEWVDALNDFYRLGLEDHAQRPYWNNDNDEDGDSLSLFSSRGGESLMALQNRPAMWGRSIISNCYGDGGVITTKYAAEHRENPQRIQDSQTNPLCFEKVCSDPLDPTVANWLLEHGIQRVVVGHKPTGDCPSVLSSAYTGVEIVSADTSFSDTSANDNRGVAVGVVQLVGASSKSNQLHLSGILQNGMRYSCTFARLENKELVGADDETNKDVATCSITEQRETDNDYLEADPFLGRQLKDGDWWVKIKNTEDDLYCLTRGNGRKVEYKFIPTSSLVNDLLKGREVVGTTCKY